LARQGIENQLALKPLPLFALLLLQCNKERDRQSSLLGRPSLLALMAGRSRFGHLLLVEPVGYWAASSVSFRPLQVKQTNRWLVVEQARIYHNCVVVRCKGRRRLLLFRSGPGPSPDLPSPISTMDFE